MICQPCRRALLQRISTSRTLRSVRTAATTPSTPNAAPVNPPPSIALTNTTPAALSSSIPGKSQPLSTPHASGSSSSPSSTAKLPTSKLRSSIPGGTELRGLSYLKAQPAIHAKEDDEYPEWLWTLLTPPNTSSSSTTSSGDARSEMTKKQRAKHDRKVERMKAMHGDVKRVPVHEQSVDLTKPGDSAVVGMERRAEVTKSARGARRRGIREDNFLKSM